MKLRISTALFASIVSLSACTNVHLPPILDGTPEYWQRTQVSESVYLQGPKAQQMLNRDIARCTTEIDELKRLGQIDGTAPKRAPSGGRYTPDKNMADLDIPERNQELFIEHREYQDFEGCMLSKGWTRTNFVPHSTMRNANDTYRANHVRTRKEIAMEAARIEEARDRAYTPNEKD